MITPRAWRWEAFARLHIWFGGRTDHARHVGLTRRTSVRRDRKGEWQCVTRGLEFQSFAASEKALRGSAAMKARAAAPNFSSGRDRDAVPPRDARRVVP